MFLSLLLASLALVVSTQAQNDNTPPNSFPHSYPGIPKGDFSPVWQNCKWLAPCFLFVCALWFLARFRSQRSAPQCHLPSWTKLRWEYTCGQTGSSKRHFVFLGLWTSEWFSNLRYEPWHTLGFVAKWRVRRDHPLPAYSQLPDYDIKTWCIEHARTTPREWPSTYWRQWWCSS